MVIKPRRFQIMFLILSLGSVIISTFVFFLAAYQIGADSIKKEAMRTVGIAANGKYDHLLSRLNSQKRMLDNLLEIETGLCGNGPPKQVEPCLRRMMTQFMKIQKAKSIYFEASGPKRGFKIAEPGGEPAFDQNMKAGQLARFYNGGRPDAYYLLQSESADKSRRITVKFPAEYLDSIFTVSGLGKNGESFLVDPNGYFLTTHRYHVESGISHPIDAKPMAMCLGGKSGETAGLDYAAKPIIHGFRHIPEIGGGCIMVHIDQREAFAGLDSFTRKWGSASVILWAVLGVISYLISQKLSEQLKNNLDEVEETSLKLRESERKYRQIFHASKAVCLLVESDTGKLFDVNAAACGYYGYTRDEMLSKTIYEINILGPAAINAAIEDVKNEKSNYFTGRHRLSSGEVRDVESALTPLTIGGKTMIYSIVHDITDRKKAETALQVSETRYRTLFDESPDGVLLFDITTAGLVDFNEVAHRQLGYTRDEFAGVTISDFEVLESQEDTKNHIAKVLAEGSDVFETKHRTKNGEVRNVLVLAKAIGLEGRSYIHCIFRDITVQKEYERRIRESEETFRHLFEDAQIGIVLYLAEGPCVMVNEAGASIVGGTRDQMQRMNFRETEAWRCSGLLDAALKSLASGEHVRFEAHLVTTFGKEVTLDCVFTPITLNNRLHIMLMFNDISHLRKAEAEMKKAKERAEEATRLKDKFIMLLSHDLKTPLIGMLGLLQLLQKQPETLARDRHFIDLAVQSNRRMLHMIDQLLDINRIRTGKLHLKCRYVDGAHIVRQAAAYVGEMAAKKRITIRSMVPEKTMVIADPVFLEQVFCNLLTNAIKFSGEGKDVAIRFSQGENMVFTVEDNGVGIAPALMKDLFSYERKTSTRGTHGEAGTGFGLPLSADIMEGHNGKLKAGPRPEGGMSFFVILPNPAPKLLIMENSPGSCAGLKELLEAEGFEVTVSPHALRILEMLEGARFDFLLVQLSAEKDTGSELIHLVGRDEKLKGMNILTIGASECYKKNPDGGPAAVTACGTDNSVIIETIYSMLMGNGPTGK